MTYLFIGGSIDGERREVTLTRPTLEVFIPHKHTLAELKDVTPDTEAGKVELYELQRFGGTGGKTYEVMVFTGLKQDVMGRLLAGYNPSIESKVR